MNSNFKANRKYLKSLFLLLFLTSQCNTFAQNLKRESIGTSGGTSYGDGYSIKHTVGQASNTQRFTGDNTALRQGFQQPSDVKGKIKECDACDLSVFPNPMENQAQLTVPLKTPSYGFQVSDLAGRIIYIAENQTSNTQNLNNEMLASGQYLLKVTYDGGCFCAKKLIVK